MLASHGRIKRALRRRTAVGTGSLCSTNHSFPRKIPIHFLIYFVKCHLDKIRASRQCNGSVPNKKWGGRSVTQPPRRPGG